MAGMMMKITTLEVSDRSTGPLGMGIPGDF